MIYPVGPSDINPVRRVNDPAILGGHVVRQDDCTNLRIAEQYGVRFLVRDTNRHYLARYRRPVRKRLQL